MYLSPSESHHIGWCFPLQERIIDGDTIRVRHCPTRFSCPKPDPNTRRIYDSTMSIRLYGVDCPELQKRKSDAPSQPFAAEATDFTSDMVLGKTVRIKLLRKDQYGRAVAKVEGRRRFPPFSRRDVSSELVRNGFATIYTGGGAEYDGQRDTLEDLQAQAMKRKRGVWSLKDMVSPAEFKRQQKVLMKANN
jgi:endonuclease YncB( thermonuclease family)